MLAWSGPEPVCFNASESQINGSGEICSGNWEEPPTADPLLSPENFIDFNFHLHFLLRLL